MQIVVASALIVVVVAWLTLIAVPAVCGQPRWWGKVLAVVLAVFALMSLGALGVTGGLGGLWLLTGGL